jgi:hypothetical protein
LALQAKVIAMTFDNEAASLSVYSAQEHERVIDAERRYGKFYVNAHDTTILLSNIMTWPVTDCEIFIRFLSQVKKYHSLSLLSTVRLHRIQAKMDLRYFLESTVNAGYALVHQNTAIYFDYAGGKQPEAQKASRQAYRWIDSAYIDHSKAIQQIKNQINDQSAHANIFNSQHNFAYVPGERAEIHTSFFDFEDEGWVKADLYQCAQAGLIAIDLLLAVQRQDGGFLPSTEAVEGLPLLIADNEALLRELGVKS